MKSNAIHVKWYMNVNMKNGTLTQDSITSTSWSESWIRSSRPSNHCVPCSKRNSNFSNTQICLSAPSASADMTKCALQTSVTCKYFDRGRLLLLTEPANKACYIMDRSRAWSNVTGPRITPRFESATPQAGGRACMWPLWLRLRPHGAAVQIVTRTIDPCNFNALRPLRVTRLLSNVQNSEMQHE